MRGVCMCVVEEGQQAMPVGCREWRPDLGREGLTDA